MTITRIYSTSDGESHFQNMDIPLHDGGQIGRLSGSIASGYLIFRENPPNYDYDWHHPPRRQYLVLLDGEIEIEVSDGEKRRFGGGDVLLMEDLNGKGHRTQATSEVPRRSLFVTLP